MIVAGRNLRGEPLVTRRELLERKILPKFTEPVRYLPELDAQLSELIASVKAQGLEGLVAKRRDSRYEPGLRTGAWQKMRVNRAQEFVIGGYTVGGKTFDAVVASARLIQHGGADIGRRGGGCVIQAFDQLPALRSHGFRLIPSFDLSGARGNYFGISLSLSSTERA